MQKNSNKNVVIIILVNNKMCMKQNVQKVMTDKTHRANNRVRHAIAIKITKVSINLSIVTPFFYFLHKTELM